MAYNHKNVYIFHVHVGCLLHVVVTSGSRHSHFGYMASFMALEKRKLPITHWLQKGSDTFLLLTYVCPMQITWPGVVAAK